jgi:diguanylate cyclase (GGDEF)-like protein
MVKDETKFVVYSTVDVNGEARVLVVDDEPVIRQFMELALSELGYRVEVVGTCREALALSAAEHFDVAFVDKNLPDGTGLQVCEALVNKDCKVALMTGYANLNSAVEAMRLGVSEYFVKPLDLEDLAARTTRMLTELRLERHNRDLLQQLNEKCKELERVAARDVLTGLYNHSHFHRELRVEIARSAGKHSFVLALVALDRFGDLNRQVGHEAGDEVLRQVAHILESSVTASAGVLDERTLICRLQGDTFALLLPETSRNHAAAQLQMLRAAVSREPLKPGLPRVTASVGFAEFPMDGDTSDALQQSAREALQESKAGGGNSILAYQRRDSDSGPRSEISRVRALGGCIANRDVRFVYQPIVSIGERRPVAYEALCRPTGNEFRHIGQLLNAAGSVGRLIELGEMLRDVAVAPIDELNASCYLFLNISPHELYGAPLQRTDSALHRVASRIVLEITETEEITDFTLARTRIEQLRGLGFRIALDDFGAGYQGFSALARLNPDYIKLDRDIVRDIKPSSAAGRLVRHIREFCDDEGIQTIAEGVETASEFESLTHLGIDLLQGYLFARPSEPFCNVQSVWPTLKLPSREPPADVTDYLRASGSDARKLR